MYHFHAHFTFALFPILTDYQTELSMGAALNTNSHSHGFLGGFLRRHVGHGGFGAALGTHLSLSVVSGTHGVPALASKFFSRGGNRGGLFGRKEPLSPQGQIV